MCYLILCVTKNRHVANNIRKHASMVVHGRQMSSCLWLHCLVCARSLTKRLPAEHQHEAKSHTRVSRSKLTQNTSASEALVQRKIVAQQPKATALPGKQVHDGTRHARGGRLGRHDVGTGRRCHLRHHVWDLITHDLSVAAPVLCLVQ